MVGGGGAGSRPGRRRGHPGRKGCARLLETARQARSPGTGTRSGRRPGPSGPERARMGTSLAVGNSGAGDDDRQAPRGRGRRSGSDASSGLRRTRTARSRPVSSRRVALGSSSRSVPVETPKVGTLGRRAAAQGIAKAGPAPGGRRGSRHRAGPRKQRLGHRRARVRAFDRDAGPTAREDAAPRGREAGSRVRRPSAPAFNRAGRAARSRAIRRRHRRAARPPARRRTRPVRASSRAPPRRTRRARPHRPRGSAR
ncbi:MAG: hypothetical protein KatS3mg117_2370 [Geminicoccaceae bacterium]|nr:MAG: hypothetical protein KatS3mg117_2370 [Geminicoccaceae bacterium]